MTNETTTNEVVIRQSDVSEFNNDLDGMIVLCGKKDVATKDFNERAKELQEKYKEHHSLAMSAEEFKSSATMLYKNTLEEKKAKANRLFDTLEVVRG